MRASAAALRMAFHHVECDRKLARFGLEEADPRMAIDNVDLGAVVVAPTKALIDDFVGCARDFQNLAEGSESLLRERCEV
jgi:hypothetical protein